MPTFNYHPLNRQRNEIRVINILPATDLASDLKCTLKHVSLDDKPRYHALSYTWGPPVFNKKIYLDSEPFWVTDNLKQALLAFRDNRQERTIWADAICINQNDLEERSFEILKMLRIYQDADEVLIWLGDASDDSGLAIDHLQQLASEWTLLQTTWSRYCAYFRWIMAILVSLIQHLWILMVPLAKSYWAHVAKMTIAELLFFGTRPRWFAKPIFYLNVGTVLFDAAKEATPRWWKAEEWLPYRATTAGPDQQTVDALASFFHRPWWERTWIIQEMISSRHATFYCGSRRLTVAELYDALDNVLRKIYAHKGANKSPYTGSAFKVAQKFTSFVDNERSPSLLRLSLLYLLCVFSESKASDSKDKIYALLGLATDKVGIEPDYNKSVEEVYIDAAKNIITSSGNLDLLNASGIFTEGSGYDLPSWVPDWTVDHHFALEHMLSPSQPYTLIENDEQFETQAIFRPSFSEDGRVLRIHGVVVASLLGVPDIRSVSGVASSELRAQLYDLLLGVSRVCGSIIDWYIHQHPLYVPFFSYMAAKNVLSLGRLWQHMADLEGNQSARSKARQRLIGTPASFASVYAADPTGPRGGPWTFWRWDLDIGYGSSPFMVANNKARTFVDDARAGDLVVFCLGTRQPYLIRSLSPNNSDRNGRSHKLVGPVTFSAHLLDSMIW